MDDFDPESQPFAECYVCDTPLEGPTGYHKGTKHFCSGDCMADHLDSLQYKNYINY